MQRIYTDTAVDGCMKVVSYIQVSSFTLSKLQSRFGDKPVVFQIVCPQYETALLKGFSVYRTEVLYFLPEYVRKKRGRTSVFFSNLKYLDGTTPTYLDMFRES